MKLYTSVGPNPHVVRMFVAEKGMDIDRVLIDLPGGENRREPFLSLNPSGTSPILALPGGQVICEILPICEYLEEVHPEPVLIGRTPEERAETRMWSRRIDLGLAEPMTNAFRSCEARGLFENRRPILSSEAGEELKAMARQYLLWLDGQWQGRQFVCGDRFTLADVMLFAFLDFGEHVGQPIPQEAAWVRDWYGRVKARPSTTAE